jgi:uracil-DNA glycosylase family 4
VLVLGERPPRAVLEQERRLGLSAPDATTRFLAELVNAAGIPRGEVILGAALLCAARDRDVDRLVPLTVKIRECSGHVRELVRAVQPRLVVPLGAAALRSLKAAFPEQAPLARLRFPSAVGRTAVAGAVFFHPLYHPSGRARLARPPEQQVRDWKRVGTLWEWIASGETGRAPGDSPSGGNA